MTHEEFEETLQFKVVVNHEEQYSIWPADRQPPAGWNEAGFIGLKGDCLAHIKKIWTDMRPLSLRGDGTARATREISKAS